MRKVKHSKKHEKSDEKKYANFIAIALTVTFSTIPQYLSNLSSLWCRATIPFLWDLVMLDSASSTSFFCPVTWERVGRWLMKAVVAMCIGDMCQILLQ